MADIDVVPKHRSNTWIWILLAIVIIAIAIWAFAGRTHTSTRLEQHAPAIVSSWTGHSSSVALGRG
jgi:hypothetical protein